MSDPGPPRSGQPEPDLGRSALEGRCLALDIGERRTGVAVGERLARPLLTLKRRSKAQSQRHNDHNRKRVWRDGHR